MIASLFHKQAIHHINHLREYGDNGTILGWLIDLETRQVEIYCPGQDVEVLQSPTTLLRENVLSGFVLNLEPI